MGHTLFHLTVFLQYSTTMDFLKKAVDAYQDSQSNTGNNNNQQQQQMHGQTNAGNNQAGGDFGVTGGSRFNQPDAAGATLSRRRVELLADSVQLSCAVVDGRDSWPPDLAVLAAAPSSSFAFALNSTG